MKVCTYLESADFSTCLIKFHNFQSTFLGLEPHSSDIEIISIKYILIYLFSLRKRIKILRLVVQIYCISTTAFFHSSSAVSCPYNVSTTICLAMLRFWGPIHEDSDVDHLSIYGASCILLFDIYQKLQASFIMMTKACNFPHFF